MMTGNKGDVFMMVKCIGGVREHLKIDWCIQVNRDHEDENYGSVDVLDEIAYEYSWYNGLRKSSRTALILPFFAYRIYSAPTRTAATE